MEGSNQFKLILLICVIIVLVFGITIGGPKFVNALQMEFGSKGKIELLKRCVDMPGCTIGPDDLSFYDRYKTVRESDAAQKIRESDAVEQMMEE
jgi:hypothetical protein